MCPAGTARVFSSIVIDEKLGDPGSPLHLCRRVVDPSPGLLIYSDAPRITVGEKEQNEKREHAVTRARVADPRAAVICMRGTYHRAR